MEYYNATQTIMNWEWFDLASEFQNDNILLYMIKSTSTGNHGREFIYSTSMGKLNPWNNLIYSFFYL